MKCRIILKTPDALVGAIERMAEDEIGAGDPDNEELQATLDEEFNEVVKRCTKRAEKWFRYGELVTLEIDFEEMTCIVVETK